jgi:hypothetical protein
MKSPTRGADAGRASSHDTAGSASPSPAGTFNCPQSGFFLPRFALLGTIPYVFGTMPSKPFELPPAAAKAFVRDMKALFQSQGPVEAGRDCVPPASRAFGVSASEGEELRLAVVKQIFVQISDPVAFCASFP